MGSRTRVVQAPYQQNTTNTFDFKSIADTPEGKDLAAWQPQIDPSIQQRSDLAQQENENRWNNDFTSGLPTHIKMRLRDSSQRQIERGASADRQNAEYLQNNLQLQKKNMLLPRLVQTSGSSSGYGSQVIQQPSVWGSVIQGAATLGAAALSDERLKNIEGRSPLGLQEVTQLEPTKYQFKPEAGQDQTEHDGFVAQEVEGVMPEAVVEDEQGVKGIKQETLIAALVNAVKELNSKVDRISGEEMQEPEETPKMPAFRRPMMGGNSNYAA